MEFNPKDKRGKNLPKELFEKFGELTFSVEDEKESETKKEINNLYQLLNLDIYKEKYTISLNKKNSIKYQSIYKDFESGKFERII